jgi:hypothetical protein
MRSSKEMDTRESEFIREGAVSGNDDVEAAGPFANEFTPTRV